MGYIILRDTFGGGLEEISEIGLGVVEEEQLNDYILEAHEHILAEEGWDGVDDYENDENNNPMGETLVICEIVDEIKGKSVDDYIYDVIREKEEKENTEEYELYLKLKKKFENG
jgi:hypothetical protein